MRSALGRLVEQHPVQTELGDRLGELARIERLAHVAVGAQIIAAQDVLLFVRWGEA